MGTIIQEIEIARSQDLVWGAIRDVGEIHKRLVPGFVTDCKLEGDWRAVTFANGLSARELIVSVDDERKRHAWSARSERLTHHNASVQVFPNGENNCRVVWIADLMPNEAVQPVREMIEQALTVMKHTLENLEVSTTRR
jgi:Polyketide cyclase / dehydrase and lipid transport